MKLTLLSAIALITALNIGGCEGPVRQSSAYKVEVFAKGALISGVNGIHFGPDGYLYAASVIGSDISVIDTNAKRIVRRLGPADGVLGPDDVAFNKTGDFYWTTILTGAVSGFRDGGELVRQQILVLERTLLPSLMMEGYSRLSASLAMAFMRWTLRAN